MKKYLRSVVIRVLWWQVERLRLKYKPIVIGVAGSVGKTSTKTAVAQVLSQKYKVAWQAGNYNDVVSIPLVFFKQPVISLFNPFAWLLTFIRNELVIRNYNYDIVLLELGTDHAGDMAQLKGLLELDFCLLTAIQPEHMENFTSLEEVAEDELLAVKLANAVVVDSDSVEERYLKHIDQPVMVSSKKGDCVIKAGKLSKYGREVTLAFEDKNYELMTPLLGEHNLPSLAFAAVMGRLLEISDEQINESLALIQPVSGRMKLLKGAQGSILVDDSYNSSPHATKAALKTLYEMKSKSKIAILGQMNEMGNFSREYHEEVGNFCDPKELTLVVTIGPDANSYLAQKAEENGCKVVRCSSPYHAGEIVKPLLTKDTAVLIKGSQNEVFAEEATKLLLQDRGDVAHLVRQSPKWLKAKRKQFKGVL